MLSFPTEKSIAVYIYFRYDFLTFEETSGPFDEANVDQISGICQSPCEPELYGLASSMISANGGQINLRFQSDNVYQYPGFWVEYTIGVEEFYGLLIFIFYNTNINSSAYKTTILAHKYISIAVPATAIHGVDACAYYNNDHPLDWNFIGKTYDFVDGRQHTGVIKSPNYPHAYKNSMYCSWKFVLQAGQSIQMNITDFKLWQASSTITSLRYCNPHDILY